MQRMNTKRKISLIQKGFSLMELLIAMSVFAVVGLVTVQSLASSFKNSRKSESVSNVRSSTDNVVSTMERLIRNSRRITSCTNTQISYIDENNMAGSFTCNSSSGGYIASGSSNIRITGTDVNIDCSGVTFSCTVPSAGVPQSVDISVVAQDSTYQRGIEGAYVTSKTKVLLRSYVDL
jgi:prepilin-type N-terminal cleavage/methylation domain-containing protein